MKLDEFNKLLSEDRYVIEDGKYPSLPTTPFNHIIFDKKTNRHFMSVRFGDDNVSFIEVF